MTEPRLLRRISVEYSKNPLILANTLQQEVFVARIYAVDYVEISLPLTNRQLGFIELSENFGNDSSKKESSMLGVNIKAMIGQKAYKWVGKIVRSEGAIDVQSRQLAVIAKIDDPYNKTQTSNQNPPLKVGQYIEAEIYGKKLTNVFVIPQTALRENNYVWVIEDETN